MKQDFPKANSPDLWKYPKLISQFIYPDLSIKEIVDKCVKYAELDWEYAEYIPLLECIIPQVLSEQISAPPVRRHIKGMGYTDLVRGASMLAHGCLANKGYIPSDSLFIPAHCGACHTEGRPRKEVHVTGLLRPGSHSRGRARGFPAGNGEAPQSASTALAQRRGCGEHNAGHNRRNILHNQRRWDQGPRLLAGPPGRQDPLRWG